jgi:hypothetical protein
MKLTGKRLAGYAGAATGVVVPAASFFSSYAPPLFLGITILTSALSAAIFAVVSAGVTGAKALADQARAKRAAIYIAVAFALFTIYMLLFQFTTIEVPRPETDKDKKEERIQIGFNTLSWSLTPAGLGWKERNPAITAEEIAANEAALRSSTGADRVEIVDHLHCRFHSDRPVFPWLCALDRGICAPWIERTPSASRSAARAPQSHPAGRQLGLKPRKADRSKAKVQTSSRDRPT